MWCLVIWTVVKALWCNAQCCYDKKLPQWRLNNAVYTLLLALRHTFWWAFFSSRRQVFNWACFYFPLNFPCLVRDLSLTPLRCKSLPTVSISQGFQALLLTYARPSTRYKVKCNNNSHPKLWLQYRDLSFITWTKTCDGRSQVKVIKIRDVRNISATEALRDLWACLRTEVWKKMSKMLTCTICQWIRLSGT